MMVLLVEDDPVSRRIMMRFLQLLEIQAFEASNGIEALEVLDKHPCPIIITDWLMPEMDGLELCRKIRSTEGEDYHYIILLTMVNSGREEVNEAADAGIDDFLTKPANLNEIRIRLRVAKRILEHTSRIQSLEKVLTICAYTKKIKTDDGTWETLENFMIRDLGLQLSHGIAPDYYEQEILPQLNSIRHSLNDRDIVLPR